MKPAHVMQATMTTAGLRVAVRCEVGWVTERLLDGADGHLVEGDPSGADLAVVVEAGRSPFPTQGWRAVTRESWCQDGEVVVSDVATSGFDLRLTWDGAVPVMTFRYRPPRRTRAAGLVLRSRARLLLRAALLQFPVLWTVSMLGRAPVHATAVDAGPAGPVLLVGASGAGKTTMVERSAAAGGRWVSDNLAVTDGRTLWGLVEPVRSAHGDGRSAPHGRRETRLAGRVDCLRPAALVVLARGPCLQVARLDPEAAARDLVASTYAAGELRRYWPLHAALSLGSRAGPAHPAVQEVARSLAIRMPCFAVELPPGDTTAPAGLLAGVETRSWT
jgi:hypothetical protein